MPTAEQSQLPCTPEHQAVLEKFLSKMVPESIKHTLEVKPATEKKDYYIHEGPLPKIT